MLLLLASRSRRQCSLRRCSHALAPSEGKSPFARAAPAPATKANPNDAKPSSFQFPSDVLDSGSSKAGGLRNVSAMPEYLASTSVSRNKGASPEMLEKIAAKEKWDMENTQKILDAGHIRTPVSNGFRKPMAQSAASSTVHRPAVASKPSPPVTVRFNRVANTLSKSNALNSPSPTTSTGGNPSVASVFKAGEYANATTQSQSASSPTLSGPNSPPIVRFNRNTNTVPMSNAASSSSPMTSAKGTGRKVGERADATIVSSPLSSSTVAPPASPVSQVSAVLRNSLRPRPSSPPPARRPDAQSSPIVSVETTEPSAHREHRARELKAGDNMVARPPRPPTAALGAASSEHKMGVYRAAGKANATTASPPLSSPTVLPVPPVLPASPVSALLRSSLQPRSSLASRSAYVAALSRPVVLSSLSNLVDGSDARSSIFGQYLKDGNKKAIEAPVASKSSFKMFDDSEVAMVGDSNLRSILEKNLSSTRAWRAPSTPTQVSEQAVTRGDDGQEVGDVTDGQRRYMQYQQRLKNKTAEVDVAAAPAALSAADMRKKIASELNAQYKMSLQQPKLSPQSTPPPAAASSSHRSQGTVVKELAVPACGLTLREVASRCSLKLADVRGKLLELGEVFEAEEDEGRLLDADVIELLGLELGLEVKRGASVRDSEASRPSVQEGQEMHARSPVVCVMGHVDHGKTTLLDALRKASVAASEAGGITQKLSAFVVEVKDRQVVFLDTPGHAAFTAMRSHGAAATDVVILVVAADDGVQPQTREAIRIAKAANCSIVIALNKIDKFPVGSTRESARLRVLTELLDLDLVAESFGGDVQVVEVSGRSGEGLDALVEGVLLQADVLNLVAASEGRAECTVLEATMEKGRGVVCDVLVSWGKLCVGDNVVVGTSFGKVKAMTSDTGVSLRSAGPASPVRLLGLRTVPSAGQELISVTSEAKARQIVERRQKVIELRKLKQEGAEAEAAEAGESGGPVEVNVLLKADGHGTLNALQQLMTGLQSRTSDVVLKVMGSGIGDVTRTEIENASTVQNVFILGFNVSLTDSVTRELAKQLDIKIFRDTVIYRLEDSLIESMQGLMPRERLLELEGTAKVLQLFEIKGKGQSTSSLVAGLNVTSGTVKTSKPGKTEYMFKVLRGGNLVAEVSLGELKRFKDVVHEVGQGNECGLSFESFRDFEVDDELECYKVEWRSKPLVLNRAAATDKTVFFDQPRTATG